MPSVFRLTAQNKAFLDYYRADPEHRHGENYMRAYPGCKTLKSARVSSCQILGKELAQQYLQKKASKAAAAVDLQEEDILRDLIKVKNMCMGVEDSPFVKVTKDGDIVDGTAADFNPAGANKALELLGKTKRMFVDKVETNTNMEVEFNFDFGDKNDG